MIKQKVAILGGGIAGLSAAHELSKTQALRDRYDVTVYQMGWRLGGKIASGRDSTGRNLEHGLHVWFGCYENAFRLLKDAYAQHAAGEAFPKWNDVFKGQPFTPIGINVEDRLIFWPITWPIFPGEPGEGGLDLSIWEMVTRLIGWLRKILDEISPADFALDNFVDASPLPLPRDDFRDASESGLHPEGDMHRHANMLATVKVLNLQQAAATAHLWAISLGSDPFRLGRSHPEAIVRLVGWMKDALNFEIAAGRAVGLWAVVLRELFVIGHALIDGVWRDFLLPDEPFESKDHLDFREWLILHGATPAIVAESGIVRALYDTAFQYLEGDTKRPSYAAGTAVGVVIRLVATYKGHMVWEAQAGMGEAVVAPIYQMLKADNVAFRFFWKVTGLEVQGSKVERVHFSRQADVTRGDYIPIQRLGGLPCWPAEPHWDQLVNGPAMAAAHVDFESHWCTTSVGTELLGRGTDFDTVILAISMGAYKPLNGEPGLCEEIIAHSSKFSSFVHNIPLVPTCSLQLWFDTTTAKLGWPYPKPAAVAGPEPLSVWADVSQILAVETGSGARKPMSLHYLCGPFATALYKEPSSRQGVPAAAAAQVKTIVKEWLVHSSNVAWPNASNGIQFQWNILNDPQERNGPDRLDAQYWRANINPGDCCVGSPAGTTLDRLFPDDTGLDNLFVAGEASRTGCNTSSIEGAIMSGMAAARAITGESLEIVGYDFLRARPSEI
jgi:uncharacterized protein with NAD-binding domain and iron-sulfur cluster